MINLIACISKNNGLGYKGELLFHYPEDMAFFKQQTNGNVVVMGRKTFETFSRPLENRRNVVLTHQSLSTPGFEEVHSIAEFWRMAETVEPDQDIYIIGGAELYRQFLKHADNIYLTEVNSLRPADAFFPQFDKSDYRLHIESLGKNYRIVRYTRLSSL